jgi:hypothetical protein
MNGAPPATSPEKAQSANDVALEYVAQRLRATQFNGQIVLHVNSGIIRKTETRDVVTTEALLTGKGGTL